MALKYKRVLLKLSGESLAGKAGHGIDFDTVLEICKPIKEIVDMGAEVAIVVGGGNFWRGRSSGKMDRTRADHMGMLATVINALGVADGLEQLGLDVWPSPTSATGRCAIWKRGEWWCSAAARATPSSPRTPARPCGRRRSRPM